ncbi:hypothetical protein FB451DRAFT_1566701, partial [Mycena latifolia]
MAAPAEWDSASQSTSSTSASASASSHRAPEAPVCDDWEDDDEDEDDDADAPPALADNQQIWDDARAGTHIGTHALANRLRGRP